LRLLFRAACARDQERGAGANVIVNGSGVALARAGGAVRAKLRRSVSTLPKVRRIAIHFLVFR